MTQYQPHTADSAAVLKLDDLHYQIRRNPIISGLSLSLDTGEILCLLGASGCGKTTVLKLIAGLISPDSGSIHISGQQVDGAIYVPTQDRNIGFVFQDYALFPHMTAAENIAFGLNQLTQSEQIDRMQACLALVDLQGYAERYPHELSGGQQQRVAVARALAPEPDIVLMDEPFSNIDSHLKANIIDELKTLFKRQGITAVFVTHSDTEAERFADKIVKMEAGKVVGLSTGR